MQNIPRAPWRCLLLPGFHGCTSVLACSLAQPVSRGQAENSIGASFSTLNLRILDEMVHPHLEPVARAGHSDLEAVSARMAPTNAKRESYDSSLSTPHT